MASGSRGALTPRPRIKSRQLIGDLARELERVRREADHLLFERDEEVSIIVLLVLTLPTDT